VFVWNKPFWDRGSSYSQQGQGSGRPRVSAENVQSCRAGLLRGSRKSHSWHT